MPHLFEPTQFGNLRLSNRIVMAPLTRNRASPGGVPNAMMATYYEQRATAGLIISEGTPVSVDGHGYLDTPGLHTDAQVDGWRHVTEAVHAKGGRIVAQIWHVGRISHVSLLPPGTVPVSSSNVAATSKTYTANGFETVSAPRELATDEVPRIVEDFRQAAARAIAAGFDGVEVHSANGYLLEQFLRDSLNHRTDAYGGNRDHRVRLVVEVMQAISDAIGAGQNRHPPVARHTIQRRRARQRSTGLVRALDAQLAPMQLAYVHVVEGSTGGARDHLPFNFDALRYIYKQGNPAGGWIVNNGYTRAMALASVESGHADAVAFGKAFISNPDLVQRLRQDAPLADVDRATLYGGGTPGYVDYPAMQG